MRRWLFLVLIGAFALAAACDDDDGADAADELDTGSGENVEEQEPERQEPPDAGGQVVGLTFSPRQFNTFEEGELVVAIPEGWIAPDPNFPMSFVPPDAEGFVAQFNVGTSCGGTCGPRGEAEWIARIEEFEFAQFRDADNFTIERESEGTQSRVLVAENSFGNVSLFLARWIEDAPKYFYCRFITSEPESYDLAQFEEACDAAGLFGLN